MTGSNPLQRPRPLQRLRLALGVLLLLVAGALAALLWWEWQQALQLEQHLARFRRIPRTPVPPLALAPEFSLPDPQSGFPELLARPLFWASRRPLAPADGAGPAAFKKGQFLLVGVVLSPNWRGALLRDVESGRIERVAEGAQIRGLTLAELAADRALLRLGGDTEELRLVIQRSAPGSSKPLAAPPTPPAVAAPPQAASTVAPANAAAAAPAQPASAALVPASAPAPRGAASASAAPTVFPNPPQGVVAPSAR
jgi:hypothetical protein